VNLDYSELEKEIKQELRRLLEHVCSRQRVRAALDGDAGVADELTVDLARQGWLAASLPAEYGGQGLGYSALAAISEELGRALAPCGFGSSMFIVAEALLLHGSEEQKRTYLPRLANGSAQGAFAVSEGRGPLGERGIQAHWEAGKIRGTKVAVADGLTGNLALVVATTDAGLRLFLVDLNDPAVERAPQSSLDPTRPLARLTFRDTPAMPLGKHAGWAHVEQLLERAAVLYSFEQIGAADSALEMACNYAKTRYAFGQPIGTFQGIKHKLADVWIANELARSNAYYAVAALARGAADLPLAAAVARVSACEALERAARENIQTHGGVAATWGNDCHLYYRRARHLGACVGSVTQWRERTARLLLAERAA